MDAKMFIKGELTPVTNDNDVAIDHFVAAAGWDAETVDVKAEPRKRFRDRFIAPKPSKAELGIDLDLSAVVINADGDPTKVCWQSGLSIYSGALVHGGDNTTGEGDGPDEAITLTLAGLDDDLVAIVTVLSAYTEGVTFKNVDSAFWQIFAVEGGTERSIAKVNLSIDKDEKALAFAVFIRKDDGTWSAKSLKRYGLGGNKAEVMALAKMAYAEYLRNPR